MIEVLMGKMDKLSTYMIYRHDVYSRKEKDVKRSTRRALSPLNDSVTKNFDKEKEDDVINHGRKSHTHQNPLYETW
jgi:hypothetical protein